MTSFCSVIKVGVQCSTFQCFICLLHITSQVITAYGAIVIFAWSAVGEVTYTIFCKTSKNSSRVRYTLVSSEYIVDSVTCRSSDSHQYLVFIAIQSFMMFAEDLISIAIYTLATLVSHVIPSPLLHVFMVQPRALS